MKELVILSGKGGTGKTSLTSAFASLAKNMILCDADVDAADLHLIMNPDFEKTADFQGGNEAVIDPDKCTRCGLCIELCRFNAIKDNFEVDPIECEGCGVCVDLCPENAIDFPAATSGQWFISSTRFGPMVHARLGIAQENSGKLVSHIRQQAKKIAQDKGLDLILTDGPPGIGCPVIASIGQATAVLIVAEPTVSGLHDMERVAGLARHFNIPAMAVINKFDLNPEMTDQIEAFAEKADVRVIGRLPFDTTFTEAMIEARTVIEYEKNSPAGINLIDIWNNIISGPEFNAADLPHKIIQAIKE